MKKEIKINEKDIVNQNIIKRIFIFIFLLLLFWFIFCKEKKLNITYEGSDSYVDMYDNGIKSFTPQKRVMNNINDLSFSNYAVDSINDQYVEEIVDESLDVNERYREDFYYKTYTENFESLISDIKKIIDNNKCIIKTDEQRSVDRVYYDKKVHPRYQNIVFQVDGDKNITDLIENSLKKYGQIRESNSNKESIENQILNYQNRLKELEAKRKALKESKNDIEKIAREDSRIAGEIEKLKNSIDESIKTSTYKTYTLLIYEVVVIKVNTIKYWYENNYLVKNAINEVIPLIIHILSVVVPVGITLLLFLYFLLKILFMNKNKKFEEKMKFIKETFKNNNIHFDIKF